MPPQMNSSHLSKGIWYICDKRKLFFKILDKNFFFYNVLYIKDGKMSRGVVPEHDIDRLVKAGVQLHPNSETLEVLYG